MRSFCTAIAVLSVTSVIAQSGSSSGSGSEEIIELSPFTVSSEYEPAYKSAESYARTRVSTPVIDPRVAGMNANVPITLLKRADAVAIQFVLSHSGDKQEARNQELYTSMAA